MWRKGILCAAALSVAGLVPVAPATAATPRYVAIVIAGDGAHCVNWHSGITGDEILNDVATVQYRPTDGIITQIDGTPTNNRADDTHYWSYWHNPGSGWVYSTSGASAYSPSAGTVEGWHFINGSSTATPPPLRSYATICGSVTPPPPATSSAARTSAAPRSTAARTPAPADPSPRTTTVTRTSQPDSSRARPTQPRAVVPVVGARATTPAPSSSATDLLTHAAADAPHRPDSGSALPTVLVLVVVLVLGSAAAVLARRRRHP